MKIHKLSAYGLGAFVLTFGATLAFGQARVPFTRPPYIVTPGSITLGAEQPLCLNGPVCTSNIQTDSGTWVNFRRNSQNYMRFSPSDLIISDKPHYFTSNAQSNVASGNQAFTCTNVGCRLSLGNTTRYIVDNAGSYAIYGAGLTVFNGSFAADTITDANGGPITYRTFASDGASAVGHIFRTNSTWSTAGAKLASFRNNTSEVSFIDYLGNMSGTSYTATSTGNAFVMPQGGDVCFNGSTCTQRVESTGGEILFTGQTRFSGYIVNNGGVSLNSYFQRTNGNITIPDNGGGTPAAYTWQPGNGTSVIYFTCNDANGCDVTANETGVNNGVTYRLVNVGTDAVNFTDTAGVTEMAGNFSMGQYDTIEFMYVTDRFVELDRSNN